MSPRVAGLAIDNLAGIDVAVTAMPGYQAASQRTQPSMIGWSGNTRQVQAKM